MSTEFCLFLTLPGIIPRQRVGTKLQSIAKGIKSPMEQGEMHIKGPSAITDRPEIGTERFPLSFTSIIDDHLPHVVSRRIVVRCTTRIRYTYTYICVHVHTWESIAPRTIGTRTVFCSAWSHYHPPIPCNIVFYTSASSSSAFSVPSSRVRRRRLVSHGPPALFRTL